MTSFRRINLEKEANNSKPKQTKFHSYIDENYMIKKSDGIYPEDHKVVIHIGYDEVYDDVFIAYDDPSNFTIYFGEAGDEFENTGE